MHRSYLQALCAAQLRSLTFPSSQISDLLQLFLEIIRFPRNDASARPSSLKFSQVDRG